MTIFEMAQRSVDEALISLRQKPVNSTLTERWFLLEEARERFGHLPQPLCMGHGMRYVLEHASLPIAAHDLLLGRFIDKVPDDGEEERFQAIGRAGHYSDNPVTRYTTGHITLDWEGIVSLGLRGYQEKAERRLAELRAGDAPEESCSILEGIVLTIGAYRRYIERYAEAAGKAGREDLAGVAAALTDNPPRTFREGLQLIWFVLLVYYVYASNPVTCLTLGRLDELLLPLYEQDLAQGRMTRGEAACYIDDFNAKTNLTLGRGEHQMANPAFGGNTTGWMRNPCFDSPTYVLIGGYSNRKDRRENELTRLFAERIVPGFKHPVYIYRWTNRRPEEEWRTVCDKVRAGASVLLYNDETVIPAMRHIGVEEEDCIDYTIHACNWPDIHGGTAVIGSAGGPIPAVILEALISEGGLRREYPDMDSLYLGIEEIFRNRIRACFSEIRRKQEAWKEGSPVRNELSGTDVFMKGVIESGRNAHDGGVKYPAVYTRLLNIGTAADMMSALDTLVFRSGYCSLGNVADALAVNFEGSEALRLRMLNAPKYGTDDPIADGHAVRLMKTLLDVVDEESLNGNGERDVYSFNVTITDMNHIREGAALGATPDGRGAGEPLSENLSPSAGVNGGVTALLKSVSALPFDRIHSGAFNLRMQKSMVSGEDGLTLVRNLMDAYFRNGGMQAQMSVADTKDLRRAQECPREYADLLVRITGYSAIFVDMSKNAQDEIIRREEMNTP